MNNTALCYVMLCHVDEHADITEWSAASFSARSTLTVARLMDKQFIY